MRVARLYEDVARAGPESQQARTESERGDGRIALDVEPLVEVKALPGPFVLEPLVDLPVLGLGPHAVAGAGRLTDPEVGERLAAAEGRARIGGQWTELAYYVDATTEELGRLASRLAGRPMPIRTRPAPREDSTDSSDDGEHYERKVWSRDERVIDAGPWSAVVRTRRFGPGAPARRGAPLDRDTALTDLARGQLLLTHLDRLDDPMAHAATLVISRVGHGRDDRRERRDPRHDGLAAIIAAIARDEWIDGVALRMQDGEIREPTREEMLQPSRSVDSAAGMVRIIPPTISNLAPRADVIVVALRDALVYPAIAGEHGCHVVQSLVGEPDLVRIEVRAGALSPRAVLADHLGARAAFEAAAAGGGVLPPNPDRLLPIARTLSYRAPLRPGEPYRVELEDYLTGWVTTLDVATVAHAVRRCMDMRWSEGRS
jgi:hypothetical protein